MKNSLKSSIWKLRIFFRTKATTLSSISAVLIVGLCGDIITTWLMNLGILRWYIERKQAKKQEKYNIEAKETKEDKKESKPKKDSKNKNKSKKNKRPKGKKKSKNKSKKKKGGN